MQQFELTAIVADAETGQRRVVAEMLRSYGVLVLGAGSFLDVEAQIARPGADVLFISLDSLPHLSALSDLFNRAGTVELVLLSTAPTSRQLSYAFEMGALDFLSKPIDDARLKRTLSRVVRRRQVSGSAAESAAEIGGSGTSFDVVESPRNASGSQALGHGFDDLLLPVVRLDRSTQAVEANTAGLDQLGFLFSDETGIYTTEGTRISRSKLLSDILEHPVSRQIRVVTQAGAPRRFALFPAELPDGILVAGVDVTQSEAKSDRLSRLVHRYQHALTDLGLFNRWLTVINAEADPISVLPRLCEEAEELAGITRMAVYRANDEEGLTCIAESPTESAAGAPAVVEVDELPKGFGLDRVHLLTRFDGLSEHIQAVLDECNIKAILTRPLSGDDQLYGIVVFATDTRRYFGRRVRAVTEIVAGAVTVALRRHELILALNRVDSERRAKQRMLERAERLTSLGSLASAIGHEINQPLQSIKIIAESALMWAAREGRRPSYESLLESMERITDRARWAAQIVKDMKTMIKEPTDIETRPVELEPIIITSLRDHESRLEDVDCVVAVPGDLPPVIGNKTQLRQVFANLIRNAADAMLEHDQPWRLTIRASAGTDSVRVEVCDTGPGVPDAAKRRIFDPLFCVRKSQAGQGLGLFVVHTILKTLGATVEVEDNTPRGAKFVLVFPVAW